MKTPELLAPGGSFLSAYHALEAGADGVYLGMKEFSARKGAQNFSIAQLRRIRQLAADSDRRIYVTLNTVIRESELESLSETLAWLEALGVDGVIVQDLGVCDLVARRFPRLPIHASTQMALHNEDGLRMARELGIRRVILPRELPLQRIRRLKDRFPDLELEVFIHGALCYSFSGICLASWALTGRSGNRGDCAQICRSAFVDRSPESDAGRGHLFSCRDLFLGREVLKLAEAGVTALKIEGRMKSPEYVFNVTRLYRSILDRGADLPQAEYEELARRAEVSFSRRTTTGWLAAPAGERLIDRAFPGHRGPVIGTVTAANGRDIELRISADLSLRDGLGFFTDASSAPVVFPVLRIRKDGREARFARAGDVVQVEVPADACAVPPGPGTEIRHMSSRFLDLPQPKESGFPLYKVGVALQISLDQAGVLVMKSSGSARFSTRVTMEKAHSKRPFLAILEALLDESGDSFFKPSKVSFDNLSGLADDDIFVPPSQLKKAKNDFYSLLNAELPGAPGKQAEPVQAEPVQAEPAHGVPARVLPPLGPRLSAADLSLLSDRRRLSPPACAPVPFVDADPSRLDVSGLSSAAGYAWLPLPPVILDQDGWVERIGAAAREAGQRGMRLAVGLNNVSHIVLARDAAGELGVSCFVDFSLYAANGRTLALVRKRVPGLLFAYSWIEGNAEDARTLAAAADGLPVLRIGEGFRPPLFYSLGCFACHVLNAGTCFDDCPKDFTRDLRQGRNDFRVVVRDCVTWLFAADP